MMLHYLYKNKCFLKKKKTTATLTKYWKSTEMIAIASPENCPDCPGPLTMLYLMRVN